MAGFRLLLDEDVPLLLAQVLRQRGYDVVHATEVGLRKRVDGDVFAAGVKDQRAVMTHNVGDYMTLVEGHAQVGRAHCGLVVAKQVPFGELLARSSHLLSHRDSESMVDAIVWLVR